VLIFVASAAQGMMLFLPAVEYSGSKLNGLPAQLLAEVVMKPLAPDACMNPVRLRSVPDKNFIVLGGGHRHRLDQAVLLKRELC
jgi:hypothetical protein